MVPQALRIAENAYKKYRTRDPFELIDARGIMLKIFEAPKSLLGFYAVMNRKQIIGLNEAANEAQTRTGAIHEIGHSLNDYRLAVSGSRFDDYKFFSTSNVPSEFNANLTGAELFIEDDFILDRIYYGAYVEVVKYINDHIDQYRTSRDKMRFEEEQMLDFYYSHPEIPTI